MAPDEIVPTVSNLPAWLALCMTILAGGVAWLLADAKSKERNTLTNVQVTALADQHTELEADHNALLVRMARSEQDHQAMAASLVRLEQDKASKDTVHAIQQDLSSLRQQMDNRFDRIERMLKN